MTNKEAQQKAFKEALIIEDGGSSNNLSLLIDDIFKDFESRTCDSCKYSGLSTMGYTRCLNEDVSHLWANDKSLPDNMNCKQWDRIN